MLTISNRLGRILFFEQQYSGFADKAPLRFLDIREKLESQINRLGIADYYITSDSVIFQNDDDAILFHLSFSNT